MKKMLPLILLMSLMTVSCNSGGGSSSEESTQSTDGIATDDTTDSSSPIEPGDDSNSPVIPAPTPNPSVPAQALSFDTNVLLYDFDSAQTEKYHDAIAIVKKVVATEAFRTKVLNHTYNGVKQYVDNQGRTNAQIYQTILDAAEKLTPAKNNVMDVGVKLYYENNSVVGWTSGSINYINVNTKFFNGYEVNEVAGNLFHEWLHKVGYGHSASATASRPYSVPYAIGGMIRTLGRNFL